MCEWLQPHVLVAAAPRARSCSPSPPEAEHVRLEAQEKLRGVAEARQRLAVEAQARRTCAC